MGSLTERAVFMDRLVADLANQDKAKDLVAEWASQDLPNPAGYVIEYTDWDVVGGQLNLFYRVKKQSALTTKGRWHPYSLVSELSNLQLIDESLTEGYENE